MRLLTLFLSYKVLYITNSITIIDKYIPLIFETQLGAIKMVKEETTEAEVLEEGQAEAENEAPVEELDEAPAGVQDLGGDDPNTGKANKPDAGTSQTPSRKADKRNPEKKQPTQGNSVKPAHEEKEVKSNTKNGMIAQVYDMLKGMSKDEISEKFGLMQDLVDLDIEELNKEADADATEEDVVVEAQEKILYSRKDLTADDIELDSKEDIEAISGKEELSDEFKAKAKDIYETAVKAKVVDEVNKRVEKIEEEYLSEIEESTKKFQGEMVEKVDNYLNYVVTEWMEDNNLAVERGIKSELTDDFMTGLRNLFKEHYIDVPEEKVDIVDDLFEKVEELEAKLNEEIDKNVSLKKDLAEATKEGILSDVCEDLADTQKEKISSLAEGVEFENEDQFKAKLAMLKESYFPQKEVVKSEDDVTETTLSTEELSEEIEGVQAQKRDAQMQAYLNMLDTKNK